MAVWNGTVTTQLGLNLIAKVVAGKTNLDFTVIRTSDKVYIGSDLTAVTALDNVKQEIAVSQVSVENNSTVSVKGLITNTNLSNQYSLDTIGLYATDPDLGEILFSITTASTPDIVPAKSNTNTTSVVVNILSTVTDSSKVTLTVASPAVATVAMLDDLKKNIFENMHPVGSIYTTTSVGFDPNATFGGLWERYAQGRTLIGVSDSDLLFSSVELTGGTKTKTLDLTNLPEHNHTATFTGDAIGNHSHTVNDHAHLLQADTGNAIDGYSNEISAWRNDTTNHTGRGYASGSNYNEKSWAIWMGQPHYHQISAWTGGSQPGTSGSGAHTPAGSVTVASTGQGSEFDVLNPYITVYFWKRVG